MQATVVTVSDPFHPMRGRAVRVLDKPARLMDLAPSTNLPFVCIRNGQAVLRRDWHQDVSDADLVAFVTLPQGGGGGSNPLRILLMIAVVALAPYAVGVVSGLAGGVLSATAASMVSAAFVAGGMVLVNALIPPPKPATFSGAGLPSASPTYSIQAQGNAARLDAPIPVQYGRLKFFPDFAALPYAEYDGNEQYLYQLFVIGQGYYDLEAIQIEDTPIDSWEDITYEVIEPGGSLTLFPANVVTNGEVAGAEAIYDTYLGPFVANAADTDANYLGVDVVFPSGLFYYDGDGIINNQTVTFTVEAIEIDDDGVDVGSYFTLGSESITAGTTTPQRYSYRYAVAAARYKVRLKRTSNNPTTTGYSTTMFWAGLRAYLPETRDYGNITMLAMRLKASNNLSLQSSRKINCIATRKLQTYDPTSGSWYKQNLLYWSEGFDRAPWALGSSTATVAAVTPPPGCQTVYLVTGVTDSRPRQAMTGLVNGGTYVVSVFAKAGSSDWMRVRLNAIAAWFDLANGVIGTQYTDDAGIESLGNGWYRCWVQETVDNTQEQFEFYPVAADTNTTASGTIYATGAQLNQDTLKGYQLTTESPASTDQVPTRSIAWALADMLRNTEYGGGLTDARIDLQALYDLDATWAAHGDTLDGRFDSADVLWTALTTAAIAGRAKPYIQGGIVHFARDEDVAFPVALFSMRNIVKGSFGVQYLMTSEETADAVEVSYFSDVSWTPQRVTAYLPGSSALKPAKLNLFGVTDREQAYREGMYYAAANRYRRKLIKFATEMEGFIPSYGDLIAVQHDMPAWGQHAEVTGWNAGTLTLTVNEPLTFGVGTHYIGLRKKNGSMEGPIVVTAGSTAYELVAESPASEPYTGIEYERTHIVFGAGETYRQPARVIAVRPRGTEQVEIECVNEDASVHTADEGITAPAVNYSQLQTLYTAPVIAGLTVRSAPDDAEIVLLSWQPSSGAEYYIIEQSSDSTDWSRVAETRANNFSFRALYGNATIMRVAAVGLTRGAWVTIAYGSSADYMWDATDSTLMWDVITSPGDGSAVLMWR